MLPHRCPCRRRSVRVLLALFIVLCLLPFYFLLSLNLSLLNNDRESPRATSPVRRTPSVVQSADSNIGGHSSDGCYGLYPPDGRTDLWNGYLRSLIATLVHQEAGRLRQKRIREDGSQPVSGSPLIALVPRVDDGISPSSLADVWKRLAESAAAQRFFDERRVDMAKVLAAVASARIVESRIPRKGTQLKVELVLDGGQRALWKPKMIDVAQEVYGGPFSGPDRHNSEIVAFHLSRVLAMFRTPVAVGRRLHVKNELFSTAEKRLKNTFVALPNGTWCLYGVCAYCGPQTMVCADRDGYMDGALVLYLPETLLPFERTRSPWVRNYADTGPEPRWMYNCTLCNGLKQHSFFGRQNIRLDLMDMAVFDYVMGNADRHLLEFTSSHGSPPVFQSQRLALLDNGKGLRNTNVDELSILAPLYQCCEIRDTTYSFFRQTKVEAIVQMLDSHLQADPLYPLLTDDGLAAIRRRLDHVSVILRLCVEKYGMENVVRI